MASLATTEKKTDEAVDEQYSLGADFGVKVELEEVNVQKDEDVANVLYSHRSKLYHFIKEDNYGGEVRTNYWKERGLGDIKIMQDKSTSLCRVIMRQEKTLKPVANFMLSEEVALTPNTSAKSWVFNCHDFSDGEVNLVQCAIKFKTQEIADAFRDEFNKAKALHDAAAAAAPKTDGAEDDLAAIDAQAASFQAKQEKRRGSVKLASALADSDYDSNNEDVDEGNEDALRKTYGIPKEDAGAATDITDAMAKATLKE